MIDLAIIKEHCRLDSDFTTDDSLITLYCGAAKEYIEHHIKRTLYASETDPGYTEDPTRLLINDSIRAAMLLCIGHWYAHREAVIVGASAATLPLSVLALLQPYRNYEL